MSQSVEEANPPVLNEVPNCDCRPIPSQDRADQLPAKLAEGREGGNDDEGVENILGAHSIAHRFARCGGGDEFGGRVA